MDIKEGRRNSEGIGNSPSAALFWKEMVWDWSGTKPVSSTSSPSMASSSESVSIGKSCGSELIWIVGVSQSAVSKELMVAHMCHLAAWLVIA